MKLSILACLRPLLVPGLGALAAAPLAAQGGVVAWGSNYYGQVTEYPGFSDLVQVDAGEFYTVALRADGSLVTWGSVSCSDGACPPAGNDFEQVVVGSRHCLALRSDGSLIAWGSDTHGLVSGVPAGTDFVQVATGYEHATVLRADGSLVSWGTPGGLNDYDQVAETPAGTDFVQVACGQVQSIALRTDGSVFVWGADFISDDTPSGNDFVQVAAGARHCLALRTDGSIVAWGLNTQGQVSQTPAGGGFVQIQGGHHSSVALHADGSVVSWPGDPGPQDDDPVGTFTQVSAGVGFFVALGPVNDGDAYCFGDGTGTPCPCGPAGLPGRGCANTLDNPYSGGAVLMGMGKASVSDDSLRLAVGAVPLGKPGIFLIGSDTVNGGLGNPVGGGLFCVGGATQRSQVLWATNTGHTALTTYRDNPLGTAIAGVGVPTNYQFWYRDPTNGCEGFNFSNAWTETWQP